MTSKVKILLEEGAKKYNIPMWVVYPIVMTESRGDPLAIGDNGKSYGLFQIYTIAHHDYNIEKGKSDIKYQIDYWMPVLAKHYNDGKSQGYTGLDLVLYTERYGEQPQKGNGKFELTSNVIKNLTDYYDQISSSNYFYLDYPVPINGTTIKITSPYGNRIDPISGNTSFHYGLDIGAPAGTLVKTVFGGTVIVKSSDGEGYGNYIIVKNINGYSELFGHLSVISVNKNDVLQPGSIIGQVGSTGKSTGNHLHYEIRDSLGNKINPSEYLEKFQNGEFLNSEGLLKDLAQFGILGMIYIFLVIILLASLFYTFSDGTIKEYSKKILDIIPAGKVVKNFV